MVETSNEITHQLLDVNETEQAGTSPGERTFFGGAAFIWYEDRVDPVTAKIIGHYTVAYFTTGNVSGLTLDFKYRRVRVPTTYEPYKIPGFFTDIEIGFVGQLAIIKRRQTDEYTDYDLFFSWQTGQGGEAVPVADLYVQQQKTLGDENIIVQYPDFPVSTDPFQGGNGPQSQVQEDTVFDIFLLAKPAP